jgi:hypothetical protein
MLLPGVVGPIAACGAPTAKGTIGYLVAGEQTFSEPMLKIFRDQ